MKAETIRKEAIRRLKEEQEEQLIKKEVDRLRERDARSIWKKIFPYKITVTRR